MHATTSTEPRSGGTSRIFAFPLFLHALTSPLTSLPSPARSNHIYDTLGCQWSDPGDYSSGKFDTCAAADPAYPPGEYPVVKNGKVRFLTALHHLHVDADLPLCAQTSISTFYQGAASTPAGHPAGKSSQCTKQATIAAASYTTKKITTTTKKATTTTKATYVSSFFLFFSRSQN